MNSVEIDRTAERNGKDSRGRAQQHPAKYHGVPGLSLYFRLNGTRAQGASLDVQHTSIEPGDGE